MRIAIMGTGGVGGYFGGLLAKSGEDVTFIARGEHLRAIREQGLRIESVFGDFTTFPAQATDDPAAVGLVDTVLFATKTHQIEAAAEAMQPMIGAHTAVLPLHNGLDASERTAAVLGSGPVLGGICQVGSQIAAPGVIRQMTQFRRVVAGELAGPITPRVERIVEVLRKANIQAEASDNIQRVRWTKFIFIARTAASAQSHACPSANSELAWSRVPCWSRRCVRSGPSRRLEASSWILTSSRRPWRFATASSRR